LPGGAENLQTPDEELVGNALSQRRFRPDNGKVNPFLRSYLSQRFYIGGLDIKVMGNLSRAGIARSYVDFLNFRALG
jgi:hypothetical protein